MQNLDTLREHLFATLNDLRNAKKIDMPRVKATVEVSQAIINTAKVEIDYLRVAGPKAVPSRFLKASESGQEQPSSTSNHLLDDDGEPLPQGIVGRRVHRLVG